MINIESEFIFTVCQVGAEPALKKEILRSYPDLRFAFSRPGYVTFKSTKGPLPADFELKSVFARTYGLSYGNVDLISNTSIADLAQSIPSSGTVHLHVWERDLHAPGEEPLGFVPGALIVGLREKLITSLSGGSIPAGISLAPLTTLPQAGEWVIHVVATDPGKFALGLSQAPKNHSPGSHLNWAGGHPPIVLPPDAPSRAYLKMENTLLWSQAPIRRGDRAIEIGSAPGGACYALLQRGVTTIGIDPAEMDRRILRNPLFTHIQEPVKTIMRKTLPDSIQWLVLDMNVDPSTSLFAVDRLATRTKDTLLGVILTVKLNQWKLADDIPYFMDHVKAMGMVRVKAAQLAYNRQEIAIYGMTRLGVRRPKTEPKITPRTVIPG